MAQTAEALSSPFCSLDGCYYLAGNGAVADDLLEEIFLRIACPTDFARGSTACASFRRLIAGPAFLRATGPSTCRSLAILAGSRAAAAADDRNQDDIPNQGPFDRDPTQGVIWQSR
ncbi:hypothetical protein C2845_PM04G27780 [Panicum miliaceum]|uniref:F-box domain-containing protein n=1 Tax=Panicum miliaceum TaxID=4540 RepID=A0A3L6QVW2_PANMI|nr:hypothetical protein C2845_PM04G27780 [Panicum miliaceum]